MARKARTARKEVFDISLFETLEDAQLLATQWLWSYNNGRTHSGIGRVAPSQFLRVA